MSPEAWIVVVGIAFVAVLAAYWHMRGMAMQAIRVAEDASAERDAALAAKASQFETWQAESQNLRADVAALERKCEAMKTDRDRFWSHLDATRDRLASAESDLRAAYAELALLRPIADSAAKLLDDEKFPGEWAEVRAAIRARKEAGNG